MKRLILFDELKKDDIKYEFTFQYEKINTFRALFPALEYDDLHSNMKRLIPIAFFALSLKRYFAIICRPF